VRVHGVPAFPDPATSLPSRSVNVIVEGPIIFLLDPTIDPQAPAVPARRRGLRTAERQSR
jgi:hypothetical protein